jgi:flagellar hook-associated protein FlgK
MTTYQDLERQKSERDIEFESLIFQMNEMIEQVEEMQKSILSLKEYLKGSVFFSADDL